MSHTTAASHLSLIRMMASIEPPHRDPKKMRPVDYADARRYWREVFNVLQINLGRDLHDIRYKSVTAVEIDEVGIYSALAAFFTDEVAVALNVAEAVAADDQLAEIA